jgi:uncharacterized coiled-coil DUF342 family protein
MSDIQRFIIYGPCVYTPAVDGEWIRYDDHRAEVERLREERDEARAKVERLRRERDQSRALLEGQLREADQSAQNLNMWAEVERLREERDEARAELLAHCASVADEVEATAETWGGKDAAAEMARRIRALMEGTR